MSSLKDIDNVAMQVFRKKVKQKLKEINDRNERTGLPIPFPIICAACEKEIPTGGKRDAHYILHNKHYHVACFHERF